MSTPDPPTELQPSSLVVAGACVLTALVRRLSPYRVIRAIALAPSRIPKWSAWGAVYDRHEYWAVEIFVLGSAVLLTAGVFLEGSGRTVAIILAALALWRLGEIVATQLGIIIHDRAAPGHFVLSLTRSVLLGLINVLEIIAIFAIIDRAIMIWNATAFVVSTNAGIGLRPITMYYLSWTTLLTLGSGFNPSSASAMVSVMVEVGIGLLIIGVTLSVFMAGIRVTESGE